MGQRELSLVSIARWPKSLLQTYAQISTQPVDELQNGARIGLDDAFHHRLADRVPNCNRNTLRVYIHPDIFSAANHRAFLSVGVEASTETLLQKGRPFIFRRVIGNLKNPL